MADSHRRPFTSQGLSPNSSESSRPLFVYDSPPIPGDPDYEGEELVPGNVNYDLDSNHQQQQQRQQQHDDQTPATATDAQPQPALIRDRPTTSSSSFPLPRLGLGGYSVSTSARTSYTRVDIAAMEETPPQPPSPTQPTTQPAPTTVSPPQTPQVHLCFLLISGKRKTMSFEPEMTLGRVKELVWNA
ncbi:hypothetical protein V5O48_017153, partial [Marasmius crinis-equi]